MKLCVCYIHCISVDCYKDCQLSYEIPNNDYFSKSSSINGIRSIYVEHSNTMGNCCSIPLNPYKLHTALDEVSISYYLSIPATGFDENFTFHRPETTVTFTTLAGKMCSKTLKSQDITCIAECFIGKYSGQYIVGNYGRITGAICSIIIDIDQCCVGYHRGSNVYITDYMVSMTDRCIGTDIVKAWLCYY